ncbi:far upstream element-binding protein 2 isoform X2 [Prunus yedoensis var. nudiflora]|uniref:Far upstream element-binding protein 2 isoform X2 n=1 Tax=Prunus yedoensis var. nudiflora TaxID=2094558 RepID=A0A314Z5Q7_PRUYE|nr:far upstream element-binding protein 2 isoform X2 [Prunus yedoensis var. nudiflora]
MADEEVLGAAAGSPKPSDHKRKLEDLEPEAQPEIVDLTSDGPDDPNVEPDAANEVDVPPSDECEAKRPRLEDKPDEIASENGYQEEKVEQPEKENEDQLNVDSGHSEHPQPPSVEVTESVKDQQKPEVNEQQYDINGEQSETPKPYENSVAEDAQEPPQEVSQPHYAEEPQQGDAYTSANHNLTHKMEVPNNKVGVLIGKAGDTIRYLQYNSGAKIQITRDSDADPYSATRPVEIIGSSFSISKAEKLINAVIAEADAGGSPSLVARGVATAQAAAAAEQIQIQVPNEKVGLIIGRGGETIKGLQTRSGARIQLIPQHLPEGDESKERTVRVTGDKKQIEVARELIKEVMNQTVRPSPLSSGFNHQGYRPHGPGGPQWGPRGPHLPQQSTYDYPQRGPYPSHNPHYPPAYGSYPQHMGPRSGFGSGWEQRPPLSMQGMPPHGGGYDYYSGQGPDAPVSAQHSTPVPAHVPGPSPNPTMAPPPSQANYNYGQPHGPDYGHPAPYSQTAPPQHSYGHGYEEPKYDNHAPTQHPYGGHGTSQPYPQTGAQPGYGPQQHYGKPQSYGMASQGQLPSLMALLGLVNQETQLIRVLHQLNHMVRMFRPNSHIRMHLVCLHSRPILHMVLPQLMGIINHRLSLAQDIHSKEDNLCTKRSRLWVPRVSRPGYGGVSASTYGAPAAAQPGYAQPTTQQSYDQSVPQSAGYGAAPTASAGYGKTVSPQPGYPQYDSSQMYAAAPR